MPQFFKWLNWNLLSGIHLFLVLSCKSSDTDNLRNVLRQQSPKTFTPKLHFTWKISSLWDSNECSFSLRFLKSQRATVYSKTKTKKKKPMSQNEDGLDISDLALQNVERKRAAPPYLQSQWPGWTRCRGWRTDSWPLQCERPLRDWAWRYYWTVCPSCTYNRGKVLRWRGKKKKKKTGRFCAAELLTSWVSGHRLLIQRGTHGEGARKHPPQRQYGLWKWSWHPRSFPPWELC